MCISRGGVLHPICDLVLSPAALDGRFVTLQDLSEVNLGTPVPTSLLFSEIVKGVYAQPAERHTCSTAAPELSWL